MVEKLNSVTVNSRKYDGSIHRTWKARLIEQNNSLLSFIGTFEKEITHQALGVIGRGTISYEFYWLDRWYNIFRFHEPNSNLRNFYCNVNLPPVFKNYSLDYVDLDIDVLVNLDLSYQILDLEEFAENAQKYSYPEEVRQKVKTSVSELIFLIENRVFPFDYKF